MENELTAIRIRKEILAEPGHEEERCKTGQKKRGDEKAPPVDKRGEQGVACIAEAFESTLERQLEPYERIPRASAAVLFCFRQIHCQRRNQCPRQDVRREHGENYCLG